MELELKDVTVATKIAFNSYNVTGTHSLTGPLDRQRIVAPSRRRVVAITVTVSPGEIEHARILANSIQSF